MLTLGYLEAKNNIYWSFNKVLFKIWLSCVARGRGWGCGSWAEGCSWGWERPQLSLEGPVEENGGYDSVNRHWKFLPTLLLGPACVREASCSLSGAQFKSLYIWSVAVSAIVPRSLGKATDFSLTCILSLMHLRLSWALLTQHFSCEH